MLEQLKMLNDALILSVSTSEPPHKLSQKQLREIADSLVSINSDKYMSNNIFHVAMNYDFDIRSKK